jgi:hypothetical protein
MNRKSIFASACVVGLSLVTGVSIAQTAKDSKPAAAAGAAQPQPPLPPGWTEADMAAMTEAATPGKMQERLAKDAGAWHGKGSFWMYPGAEAVVTESDVHDEAVMGGRYVRSVWTGEMPGAGPFTGEAIKGFDNAAGKFAQTWIDNMSTGLMTGTGELSADGKTINWTFSFTCPLTKKPAPMRQIETWKDENTKTVEMWGVEPKSGKEFKMMFTTLTRQK